MKLLCSELIDIFITATMSVADAMLAFSFTVFVLSMW